MGSGGRASRPRIFNPSKPYSRFSGPHIPCEVHETPKVTTCGSTSYGPCNLWQESFFSFEVSEISRLPASHGRNFVRFGSEKQAKFLGKLDNSALGHLLYV